MANPRSKRTAEGLTELVLVIPLTPPSVNHYKQRARNGHWYVTGEATAFKEAVCIIAQGRYMAGKRYQVDAKIYLGKGQRGDCDNFWKVILDGLKDAGVIHSDSATHPLWIDKDRDEANPRTEIRVRSL